VQRVKKDCSNKQRELKTHSKRHSFSNTFRKWASLSRDSQETLTETVPFQTCQQQEKNTTTTKHGRDESLHGKKYPLSSNGKSSITCLKWKQPIKTQFTRQPMLNLNSIKIITTCWETSH